MQSSRVLVLCLLLLASVVLAAPGYSYYEPPHYESGGHKHNCSVSDVVLVLPNGQTVLSVPAGEKPEYIALGTGVQNYTCNATSLTYTSIGAVAKLYDIGCLADKPVFDNLPSIAFNAHNQAKVPTILSAILRGPVTLLGEHTFITNPVTGTGISPLFDFRVGLLKNDPDAFFVGAKTGDLAAPENPTVNVDWLELNEISGGLAKTVFRAVTAGGQPPKSCTAGSPVLSVKYAAQYWFFPPA